MIDVRPFASLGAFRNDWLNAKHHFSFANYYDPARVSFGKLRVWNDDEIQPGTGFDPHPHREMEIVTFVHQGAITHKDNLGNQGRTVAGDVQVMSAGTGIVHAEYNLEPEATRIFQIWIEPDTRGAKPSWGTKEFPKDNRDGSFTLLAGGRPGDAEAGALPINANAAVFAATVKKGETVTHALGAGRKAYLVPPTGAVTVNGIAVATRDGAAIDGVPTIEVTATEDAEVVMVEVAG